MAISSRYHTVIDPAYIERQVDPISVFLIVTVIYTVALSVSIAANSPLLKLASNGAAVVLFLVLFFFTLYLPKRCGNQAKKGWIILPFGIYYTGLILSFVFNAKNTDVSDALKMLMAPAFLVFGLIFSSFYNKKLWPELRNRQLYWTLAVLPFIVWAWQLVFGFTKFGEGNEVGIFANRNNAALFAITLLAFFSVLSGRPVRSIYIYIGVAISFGTLGVLVATLTSLMALVARLREFIILAVLAGITILFYQVIPEIGILKRLSPVLDTIRYLFTGRLELSYASYADLVLLLKTNDLSFAFRIKHWMNLLDVFFSYPGWNWLSGHGVGSSVKLSAIQLVPHNDYLRVFFECGILAFVGFVAIIVAIIMKCGRRWETVPLLAVAVYFFSENLVNNYLAMTIFYFCAGALIIQRSEETHVNIQVD